MEEKKPARFQVWIAGYGGQGILTMGKFLAEAGMLRYKHVVYFPSYGGAQRGGESTCSVTLSDEEIGALAPLNPSAAIIMSPEALQDLEKRAKLGSIILVDSSTVTKTLSRQDIKAFYIPATEIALKLGDSRVAGFILVGAYLEMTKAMPLELVEKAIAKKLRGERRKELAPLNRQALRKGAELIRSAKSS